MRGRALTASVTSRKLPLARQSFWKPRQRRKQMQLVKKNVGLIAILLIACAALAQSAPANNKQKDIEELSRFRLSMENVTKVVHALQELEELPEYNVLHTGKDAN